MGEHLRGELAPERGTDLSVLDLPQHGRIVHGVGHHQHLLMILRRGPEHGRPADVDVLDGIGEYHVGFRDGALERIEVHRHQVDRGDAVLLDGAAMLHQVTASQDATVHGGVQRLHPPIQHLGKAGDLFHGDDRNAGLLERVRRATGGHDLPAELDQPARKGNGTTLVTDGNEGAWHRLSAPGPD